MNKEMKEIITEAVLGFLNKEARQENTDDEFKLPVDEPEDPSAHYWEVPIKHKTPKAKKPIIHPSYDKPPTQLSPPGVNEEDLSEEQKVEVKEIVTKTLSRPGFLGISFATNLEENTTTMGVRVDPTGGKDWVLAREEVLYTLPMKRGKCLQEYVKLLRK